MKYGELTLGQIEAIVNKLGGMDGVRRFLSGEIVVSSIASIFTILVDYSQSLAQMISSGKYDWVNSDITEEHFPTGKAGGKAEFHLELLHFNKVMFSDQVLTEMKKRSLRPATLSELLAFGEKYPEEQRKYPIVALGSVWRHWGGRRRVPFLCSYADGRGLGLRWFGYGWVGGCRFLAVRES